MAYFHFLTYCQDDSLVFTEYFYYMGRGNGKDGFVATLVSFFQSPYFPVKKYNIDVVANSEKQSEGTFQVVYDTFTDKKFARLFKQHFNITKEQIRGKKNNSILRFATANSKTKDGGRPGCIVFNELHAYENYDNINVHSSGLGKVK